MGATLDAFVRRNILGAEKRVINAAPERSKCAVIRRVAAGSIAFGLGLREGDLLIRINGKSPAQLKGLKDLPELPTELHFYTADAQRIKVTTTGIDPGFDFEMPSSTIAELAPSKVADHDLYMLWDRGNIEALEAVCRRILTGDPKRPSLFDRLKGNDIPFSESLATFYLAACRMEAGDRRARKLFDEWSERYIGSHKSEHNDVWRYHVLRRRLLAGERSTDTIKSVKQTYAALRGERMGLLLDEFDIARPPEPDANSWKFPVPYDFQSLLQRGRRGALQEKLDRLEPHQVHLVAAMQTYRTNEVYSDFCAQFREIRRVLDQFVVSCDVITEDDGSFRDSGKSDAEWMLEEQKNLEMGLPQDVLFDDRRNLFPTLKARVCPTVYAVSKDGMVVKQGWSFYDVWEALSRLSA